MPTTQENFCVHSWLCTHGCHGVGPKSSSFVLIFSRHFLDSLRKCLLNPRTCFWKHLFLLWHVCDCMWLLTASIHHRWGTWSGQVWNVKGLRQGMWGGVWVENRYVRKGPWPGCREAGHRWGQVGLKPVYAQNRSIYHPLSHRVGFQSCDDY